jgi:protein phosphatase
MIFFTLSDKGKVRRNNEDYAESFVFNVCNPEGKYKQISAMLLCDGMGGGPAGERASYLAVKTVKSAILEDFVEKDHELTNSEFLDLLDKHIQKAHFSIYKEGVENKCFYGMGTTIVAGVISEGNLLLSHVGDSRGYSYNSQGLKPLTKDHSLVQQYVDEGKLTPEEAFTHPQKNIITRVLGGASGAPVKVDKKELLLEKGEIVMFCTDGLCGVLKEPEISEIFKKYYNSKGSDLKSLANELLTATNSKGSPDNITITLYQHIV